MTGASERQKDLAPTPRGRELGALSILLLLIQLVLAGSAVDGSRLFAADAAQSVAAQTCDAPSHDRGAPDGRARHSDCCLLCQSARGDDASLIPPVAAWTPRALSGVILRPRLAATPMRRPAGWTGSWSSRAPPAFS
ncbi:MULTISPECIES: DUF2946 family protein [Methylosinus]|uniref:DUF2946 domain-containing protein n=1 Tax=Methylosinus trichosporium (strain ATCC 35070 / NCIMB 11131 / UNIQEM 75 / OB3b) TaxID=595536 RepID=A0A2D2D030_METT3|nr:MULTISPECIES: DUF2946 family protein [Methylosinus]ATQ68351.1 DUF2946 domain-containing protein [Methylosinus trichosporium OB3b]OBS50911.1 hypothetical protein A8B73_18655 [Methylosinus sp. 3S-1]